ncbi:MAG: hypothetical protein A2Y10_18090 [Planctomycetes bacterium GWF2_41_51]|nr:MAG: hypothetical protein A2Y10_18090 [Planctomycetes bacterium GWF2_41_51]
MPLPITKPQEIQQPNAIYVPQIILQTNISNGQLTASAIITLMPAKCENNIWTETGGTAKTIFIPNVLNLESDISDLQPSADELFNGFLSVIGQINSVRRVL